MMYFCILLAWCIGGFVNNITGMGAAIIALPIMALYLPMNILIPVGCACGAAIGVYLTILYYQYLDWKTIFFMSLGSIPGSICGTQVLLYLPSNVLEIIIGLFLLLYAMWQLFVKKMIAYKESYYIAFGTAMISGLANASISFGGPPGYIYSSYVGWDRKKALGTLSCFYCFMSSVTIFQQISYGLFDNNIILLTFLSLTGMFIGIIVSIPFVKKIDVMMYRKLLISAIIGAGFLCLYHGYF